jgi:hypothetical protein
MPEQYEKYLRWATYAVAALLLIQVIRAGINANPLRNVVVPSPPQLADAKGTNNDASVKKPGDANKSANNNVVGSTNKTTNALSATNVVKSTNLVNSTNVSSSEPRKGSTNVAGTNGIVGGTNAISGKTNTGKALAMAAMPGMPPGMERMGMRGGMSMPGQGGAPEIPPVVKAKVSKITDSEILAPVVRPMPAALIGIAGESAFLRSSTGQTGMIKEGEDLGGMKLLKIGTNRVLVEESGEKKELMIFAGMGGDSLMPKEQKDK